MADKKYYWLKLKDDFFDQKEIKRLRRIAGGDTYTVIYLKLLLLSLKTEGKIYFDDIGDDFVDELSLEIDEDIENIKMTLSYLESKGLLEIVNESEYFMNQIPTMIGSESDKAQLMRNKRARDKRVKKVETGGDSNNVTENGNDVTEPLPNRYTEKEIEKEIDKENNVQEKPRSNYKFEQHHMQLAELLAKKIKENNPNAKEPNYDSWANTFRLMMERPTEKREGKEIQDIIIWSQQDSFWYKNILSADKIRKQYDRLLLQMKDEKNNPKSSGGKKDAVGSTSYESSSTKYDFSKRRGL